MYVRSNRENLRQAFDFAYQYYGITQLIDPEGRSRLSFYQFVFFLSVLERYWHRWSWREKYSFIYISFV